MIALPLTNTSDFGVQVSFPVISVPAIFTKTAWVEGKTGIASVFLYSHTEHVLTPSSNVWAASSDFTS